MATRRGDTKAEINYIKANYDKLIVDEFQKHFKCSRSKTYAMLKRNLTPNEYKVFLRQSKKRHRQYNTFTSELKQELMLNFKDIVVKDFIEEHNLSNYAVTCFLRENKMYKVKDERPPINMSKEQKEELRKKRKASAEYYLRKCWKLCGIAD